MCNYVITDQEIEKAEKDVLRVGECFNDKQRNFIRCLDGCCVQAYAGTGKTTSIVGKLHILAQKRIWRDGRGICVISHTNVAVNEIKNHVARYYPQIMQYPNFVGTIQEFVNHFLFIPYLSSRGLKIKFQEESRYFKVDKLENSLKTRCENYIKSTLNHVNENSKEKFYKALYSLYIFNDRLYSDNKEFLTLKTKAFNQKQVEDGFKNLISKFHQEGRFLFDESFSYGLLYLQQNPILENAIAERFRFVFLDEAQDCSKMQLDLLNKLFDNNLKVVFQQIGDENQAISETEWHSTGNVLSLDRSTRFGNNLASFVNQFETSSGGGVVGTSQNTEKYLVIYPPNKEKEILKIYTNKIENLETIKKGVESGAIKSSGDFFAIAYWHEHLTKYYKDYSKIVANNRNKKIYSNFKSDIEYLNLITRNNIKREGGNFIAKVLFSLLFKHLKLDYSWGQLKEYLRNGEKGCLFREIILNLSNDILQNNKVSNPEQLKIDLNSLINKNLINFGNNISQSEFEVADISKDNKFIDSKWPINIGTIHSVKGQTHAATLFFANIYGAKKQETELQKINGTGVEAEKFKRLLYVASSRPKYLFVFAIEEDVYNQLTQGQKDYFRDFKLININ